MKMLAQSPSSFLDSESLGVEDDFNFADGPLFAELQRTINVDPFAADENINTVDMCSEEEEEFEKYINDVSSDSLSTEAGTRNLPFNTLTCQNPKVVIKKLQLLKPTNDLTIKAPKQDKFVPINSQSEGDEDCDTLPEKKESLCMSRNAVAARENRQKKKQYLESLEQTCERLSSENFALKTSMESKEKQLKSMAQEIKYLQNVLANETALSSLLKNIHQTSGLEFGSSFLQNQMDLSRKRPVHQGESHSDNSLSTSKRQKTSHHTSKSVSSTISPETFEGPPTPCASPELKTTGGVCLHVSNSKVSLEFCSACANSAADVWNISGDHTYNKIIKQEPCDYIVIKQEMSDSDGE